MSTITITITNPEFQTHRLNETGIKKVEDVKQLFDEVLNTLQDKWLWAGEDRDLVALLPPGRHLSIVKTKLEEACMFAVKAVSCDPANQKVDEDQVEVKQTSGFVENYIAGQPTQTLTTGPRTYSLKDFPTTPRRIPDTVTINGAKIIGPALIDILNMVTQPNPRRWYRFERQGELITVQTKESE